MKTAPMDQAEDRADCVCGHPHAAHPEGRCTSPRCGCPIWRDSGIRSSRARRAVLPDRVDHHAGLAPGELGPVIHRDPSSPLFGGRPAVTRAIGMPTPEMLAEASRSLPPDDMPPVMDVLTAPSGEPAECGAASAMGACCTLPERHRGPHVVMDDAGNVLAAWARDGGAAPAVRPDQDREWIRELERADGQIRRLVEALVAVRDHPDTPAEVRDLAWAAIRQRFAPSGE